MKKDEISKGLAETDLADSCLIGVNDAGTSDENDTRLTQVSSPGVHGWTYFIRVDDAIKIGFASNFKKRISSLQTSHQNPLDVLAVVPAALVDEYKTHQLFSHLRIRGEWFRADHELLYFIDAAKAAGAAPPALEHPGALAALNAKATSQDCTNLFTNPTDIRRTLMAKGKAEGWDTPRGHTYSNMIQILETLPAYERPAWAADIRQTLPGMMNKQIERLERLNR